MGALSTGATALILDGGRSAMKQQQHEKQLITFREAAKILGRSRATVYRMVDMNCFRVVRCPKQPMIVLASLMAFIEGRPESKQRKPPARAGDSGHSKKARVR